MLAAAAVALATLSPAASGDTKLLWGDTHLHTSYSFDAFFNNNLSVDPDYAYRFAKGIPVMHPYHRAWMRLEVPLDFLVVSDHAEFIGAMRSIYRDGLPQEGVGIIDSIRNWFVTGQIRDVIDDGQGPAFFQGGPPARRGSARDRRRRGRRWGWAVSSRGAGRVSRGVERDRGRRGGAQSAGGVHEPHRLGVDFDAGRGEPASAWC